MTQPEFLSVKHYREHQHYRDRNPVWIKLYNAVMDDAEFIDLTDAERGQLMLIWLLASRRNNKIPNDATAVKRAIQASGRVHLERFIAAGFLIPYQPASTLLANEPESSANGTENLASVRLAKAEHPASTHARPRARGEGEREEETERESSSSSATVVFDAIGALLARIPESSRPAWQAEIAAAEHGMHGAALTPDQIQTACRDYLGNQNDGQRSLRHFRGYLRSIGQPTTAPDRSDSAPRVNAADAAWDVVLGMLPAWQRREITADTHAQLPEGIRRGLSKIGGFRLLAETPDAQRVWLKKDFIAAYRAAPVAEHAHA